MVLIAIFTKSTKCKLKQDPFFLDFVDDAILRFKRKEYHYNFNSLVDFDTWYNSSAYSEYYYPGGNLVISKSMSDGNITADWFPVEE